MITTQKGWLGKKWKEKQKKNEKANIRVAVNFLRASFIKRPLRRLYQRIKGLARVFKRNRTLLDLRGGKQISRIYIYMYEWQVFVMQGRTSLDGAYIHIE